HFAETLTNAVESGNRDRGERRRRFLEILRALLQNRRNIFDAGENLLALRLIVRRGNGQSFGQRGERLLDVKIRISFPAWVEVEFSAHPRQRRANQFVIDLFW